MFPKSAIMASGDAIHTSADANSPRVSNLSAAKCRLQDASKRNNGKQNQQQK
jgi:hypothetical protein